MTTRKTLQITDISLLLLCLIVLYGWFSNTLALTYFVPTLPQMQVNTALCFALLALTGLSTHHRIKALSWLSLFIGLAITVTTLAQYIFKIDIGVDTLFFTPKASNDLFPGRMAPTTAICFLACFTAFTINKIWQSRTFAVEIAFALITVPISVAGVSLAGILLGLERSLSEGHIARMSIPTIIAFALITLHLILSVATRLKQLLFRASSYVMLLLSLASVAAWLGFTNTEVNRAQVYTNNTLNNLTSALDAHYEKSKLALARMADRWEAAEGTTYKLWQQDADNYIKDQPWHRTIEWVDRNGTVRWVSPETGNEQELGINLKFEPKRRQVLEYSRNYNTTVLSSPVTLIQGGDGLLMAAPIFFDDKRFGGHMLGIYDLTQFFDYIMKQGFIDEFGIAIYFNDMPIYQSEDDLRRFSGNITASTTWLNKYQLQIHTLPQTIAQFRTPLPEITLILGLLLSCLLGLAMHYWRQNQDVLTKLRKQEELLVESLEMQKTFVEELGEALVVVDKGGEIKEFSNEAQRLFGYKKSEVIGHSVKMLMPQDIAIHHDDYMQSNQYNFEKSVLGKTRKLAAIKKNGEAFPVEIVVSKVELKHTLLFVALIRDITELEKYQEDIKTQRMKAQQASQIKSEFLANMSHEIRTPLNSIMGTLRILHDDLGAHKYNKLVASALFSSKSLLAVINDILDFSKIEARMLSLESIPFSVKQIIDSVTSDLAPIAEKKQLSLNTHIEEDNHEIWLGDPYRVRQILLNIVSNAVKFTERGGVDVHVSTISKQQQTMLQFLVIDSGIGMGKVALDNLFGRFTQAESTITRRFGGTGLGMAITKNLIEIMHGSIHVESRENVGTTFTIQLPLKKSTTPAENVSKLESILPPDLSGKTILVAEDNDINQIVIDSMLSKTNAILKTAKNGVEAVNILKQIKPDLILMDIHMPVMDGIKACQSIKSINPEIPIIALTADVMTESVRMYRKVGFDGHIAKPIDLDKLYLVLGELMKTDNAT
ncbi:ATP-binding protein [Pseudoalteromonas sp. T1lg65]|uniref:ATP-binding protein n=1 Tax=Pseudoalteromonas sp. T1lg65 TaxID=2077101 RepID=UPI003F79ED4D